IFPSLSHGRTGMLDSRACGRHELVRRRDLKRDVVRDGPGLRDRLAYLGICDADAGDSSTTLEQSPLEIDVPCGEIRPAVRPLLLEVSNCALGRNHRSKLRPGHAAALVS